MSRNTNKIRWKSKGSESRLKSSLVKTSMKKCPLTPVNWVKMPVVLTDSELVIGGWQVIQRWEEPLMKVMAREVTATRGDILEVGFGMGIAANEIMKRGCRSYTVIEAHPMIAEMARQWTRLQKVPATVIPGLWQEIVPKLDSQFDGILFDTYPLWEQERHRNYYPFIPLAPYLLRQHGVLTYYSDETIEFRVEHLKLLLTHFAKIKLIKVSGLKPFPNCEYWHDSTMIIPVARI